MFCTKCGKSLPEGSKFCTGCGQPVQPAPQPAPAPAPAPAPVPAQAGGKSGKKRTGLVVGLLVAALVLAAVAGGLIWWLLTRDSGSSAGQGGATPTQEAGRPESGQEVYAAEHFEEAGLEFVSADVSDYPVVRAYFRVKDRSGQSVRGLSTQSFAVGERLQGGEYLAREVRGVTSLDRRGLNIDLVADKSGSMFGDMYRTKQVMVEFINSLDYGKGDRAEVLAFDDIVEQMCYYTGNRELLIRGVNNMAAEGQTALYNALWEGIHNAALQGGARCVIAFTDGEDNMSGRTPQEVINYANTSQVPVYIVGVGSAGNSDQLRSIAQSTGGRYWYIDDLTGLSEIYARIYDEQQELYMVEYVSDAYADRYAYRELSVTLSGEGYHGAADVGFTPVYSVGNQTHASRYELVKESMSWEEAARRCQEMGGHLATITSAQEERQIISMAEAAGVKYVWLGGYTSFDNNQNIYGHWITGEDFVYSNWTPGEPSRIDQDGTPERYLMLWYIRNQWAWNDQRNDPAAVVSSMAKSMGFVCEYES